MFAALTLVTDAQIPNLPSQFTLLGAVSGSNWAAPGFIALYVGRTKAAYNMTFGASDMVNFILLWYDSSARSEWWLDSYLGQCVTDCVGNQLCTSGGTCDDDPFEIVRDFVANAKPHGACGQNVSGTSYRNAMDGIIVTACVDARGTVETLTIAYEGGNARIKVTMFRGGEPPASLLTPPAACSTTCDDSATTSVHAHRRSSSWWY